MFDISTYLDRITSQHKIKPRFMALLASRLQPFIDIAECLESFDAAFDLDTAVGKQLDIIGEHVGMKRLLDFQPQLTSALLSDYYYRVVIKAKISLNNWDGTVEGARCILSEVFPDYTITVVDNQNMTMGVQIVGEISLFESELIQRGGIAPKPMGVLTDYYVLVSITLDTRLYIGTCIYDRVHHRRLPEYAPQEDNRKPSGDLCIAGLARENRIVTTIAKKTGIDTSKNLCATNYCGGIKTSSTLRYVLPSTPL